LRNVLGAATLPSMATTGSQAALKALAEPSRVAMLRLVRDGPRSVGEIAEHFAFTQQAVSQHLGVLREAGLVAVRKDGQRRLYVVRPDGLAALEAFLRELWPSSLEELKRVAEEEHGGR
jgi:DNA-binding transcriptional ArsR family regulator